MRLTLILLISALFCTAQRQRGEERSLYFSTDLQINRFQGFDFALNYVTINNFTAHIGVSALNIESPSAPENYAQGLDGFFSFGFAAARDRLFNYRVGMGKLYKINPKGTLRFHPQVGLGISIIETPINFQRINNAFLTQNYEYDFRRYATLSITISPRFEIPIFPVYGLSISPIMIINKGKWHYGIGFGYIIGRL